VTPQPEDGQRQLLTRAISGGIVVPMTAYLDESGTHDGSRLTVMAGWVEYADRWSEFDRRWNALLRRPLPYRGTITHIHGKDLRQGSKQFRGWSVEDRHQRHEAQYG
jgi:hypothetical protein